MQISVDVETLVKEAGAQIASLASKNLILAAQLAAAQKQIAMLQAALEKKKK